MDNLGSSGFMMKKRRSATSRRPRPEGQLLVETASPPSSMNNSDKLSPDDSNIESSFRRKEYFLNNPPPPLPEPNSSSKKSKRREFDNYYGGGSSRSELSRSDSRRSSEGVLAPAKWKNSSGKTFESELGEKDGHGSIQGEGTTNVRKVKLKVGGVTRTIHAKAEGEGLGNSATKPPRPTESSRHHMKFVSQDSSSHSPSDQWKDSGASGYSYGTRDDRRSSGESRLSGKQSEAFQGMQSTEHTRKSKRVPKKRVFDDGEDDDRTQHREKVKTSKLSVEHAGYFEENEEDSVKKKKLSKLPKSKNTLYDMDVDYVSRSRDSRRRLKQVKESEDMDYLEEDDEEMASDELPDAKKKKQKAINDSVIDARNEPLTTRQRALQSGKGTTSESMIEYPEGLPPALSKKSKEKLSEVEIQAKKLEAAQRRRMQVEKQAREIEASAIRKILGHDSDKKKEEKKQKELEEKQAAKSEELGPGTIRLSMGPNGTFVTFSEDVGLPSIFSSKATSYPPPREKCAGPSCLNPFKYRDAKSKLPLCSLQCYRAVRGS